MPTARIQPRRPPAAAPERPRSGGLLLSLAAAVLAAPSPLPACQICLPFPELSAADFILDARDVVLAREDPERPFHYAAVEVLKGDPDVTQIDLFVDSATRRALAGDPDRAIILTRVGGDADSWSRAGTADPTFGPVAREILKLEPDWNRAPEARPAYFAAFLGHPDRQLRHQAHLEVARAPYDQIQRLAGAVPRSDLLAFLADFRMTEWHALYILMLAQTGEADDHRRIEEAVRSHAGFSLTTQLAAWTTAYIETAGAEAIRFLTDTYFADPNRGQDEVEAVLLAHSVHGTCGRVDLQDDIVSGYKTLLANHPVLAPKAVADLATWNRLDLAGAVESLLASGKPELEHRDLVRLRSYARGARISRSAGPAAPAGPPGTPRSKAPLVLLVFTLAAAAPALVLLRRARPPTTRR